MGGTCPRSPREAMSEPRLGATQDPSLALQPGLSLHKVGGRWLCDPSSLPRITQGLPRDTGYAGCCWLQRTSLLVGPKRFAVRFGTRRFTASGPGAQVCWSCSFQTGEMSLLRPDPGGLGEGVQGTSPCPGNPADEA